MTPARARQLLHAGLATCLGSAAVMLLVMLWAGEQAREARAVDGDGYDWTAIFLLLTGVPTLLLGGVALLLLRRRPAGAGVLVSLAGVLVLFGGTAAFGILSLALALLAGVVAVVLIGLGIVGGHYARPAPR